MAKTVQTKQKASQRSTKEPQTFQKQPAGSKPRKLTTTITLSGNDLAALADYLAAGMLLLRITTPHRVVGKLKAGMSRLKVPIPIGL
jgi:hypothetical protein